MLIKTLLKHFSNGFRIESPIELLRLRGFIAQDFGESIALSDNELTHQIISSGILFDKKVYIVETDVIDKIKNAMDFAIDDGVKIVFYGAFYEHYEALLHQGKVVSEDMLKTILETLYPQFLHKKNHVILKRYNVNEGIQIKQGLLRICCSENKLKSILEEMRQLNNLEKYNVNERIQIKQDILRVWDVDMLLSFDQLSARLPYIPIDKIKTVLTQNEAFIFHSEGVYMRLSKVDVTNKERAIIALYAMIACSKNGYVSFSSLPLDTIRERNHTLPLTAIYNVVFAIVLADKYDKCGKIVTRKGDSLDALMIMKEHCRSLDRCSLQDLFDFERELTGEIHHRIPLEAGYATMIRTGENAFVAPKHVCFDVLGIDAALEKIVTGKYLSLKSVTSFATFPDCGQMWNLFLLESYCRRESMNFRFDVLAYNSRNTGVIVRKDCGLSYFEIMLDAVVSAYTSNNNAEVLDFLYCEGYLSTRSYTKIDELLASAKAYKEKKVL